MMKRPRQQHMEAGTAAPPAQAFRGNRLVYFAGAGFVETPTYDRTHLVAANTIKGPALIEEYASTTVVHPGDALEVDGLGNLIITTGRS
jgi:N-methylhydantoinase A